MDGLTDRHRTTAKTALMPTSCGKNLLQVEDYFEMRLDALNLMDRYRLGLFELSENILSAYFNVLAF